MLNTILYNMYDMAVLFIKIKLKNTCCSITQYYVVSKFIGLFQFLSIFLEEVYIYIYMALYTFSTTSFQTYINFQH